MVTSSVGAPIYNTKMCKGTMETPSVQRPCWGVASSVKLQRSSMTSRPLPDLMRLRLGREVTWVQGFFRVYAPPRPNACSHPIRKIGVLYMASAGRRQYARLRLWVAFVNSVCHLLGDTGSQVKVPGIFPGTDNETTSRIKAKGLGVRGCKP